MNWLYEYEIDGRVFTDKVCQQVTDKLIKELGLDSLENKASLEKFRKRFQCEAAVVYFFNVHVDNPCIWSYISILNAISLNILMSNNHNELSSHEIIKEARNYTKVEGDDDVSFQMFIKFVNSYGEYGRFRTFIKLVNGLLVGTLFGGKPGAYVDVEIICD